MPTQAVSILRSAWRSARRPSDAIHDHGPIVTALQPVQSGVAVGRVLVPRLGRLECRKLKDCNALDFGSLDDLVPAVEGAEGDRVAGKSGRCHHRIDLKFCFVAGTLPRENDESRHLLLRIAPSIEFQATVVGHVKRLRVRRSGRQAARQRHDLVAIDRKAVFENQGSGSPVRSKVPSTLDTSTISLLRSAASMTSTVTLASKISRSLHPLISLAPRYSRPTSLT